jgi:TolB-like protein/tetratricopeptide (TPR) repeat protein
MSTVVPEFSFGDFRLDPEQRLLLRGATVVPLTPKAYDLLAALLRRRGRVVDHDRLMAEVWPDTVVEPGNLAKLVFQIRGVLGEAPDGRPWVETLPRRGYRLNAEAAVTEPAPAPAESAASAPMRVAVLSFADLSPHGDEAAFCEGIAEEILLALVRVPGLRVIARTSSFRFGAEASDPSEVARRLDADALVLGSVRTQGDRVRVTARLVDGADGGVRWAQAFERPRADVFEIQRDIADAIGRTLERGAPAAVASPRVPTRDLEAWQDYLDGRFLWNRRWSRPMQEALARFERAVERDPDFAAAWAGIADVYSTMGSWEAGLLPHDEAQLKAREHARKALALDPELADAYATLAYVALHYDRDFAASEREFAKALARNPSYAAARHWRSHLLVAERRFDEALEESRATLALDPMNLLLNVHMGWHWHMARRPEAAIEASDNVIRLDPAFHWGHFFLGLGAVQAGDPGRAVDALREAARCAGDSPVMLGALGHAHAVAGDGRAARTMLKRLADAGGAADRFAFERALVLGALGDADAGIAALASARRHRSGWLAYADVEPRLDPLRADPRFAATTAR